MINRRSVICERRMRVRGWGGGANEARTGGVRKERKRGWSRSVSHLCLLLRRLLRLASRLLGLDLLLALLVRVEDEEDAVADSRLKGRERESEEGM